MLRHSHIEMKEVWVKKRTFREEKNGKNNSYIKLVMSVDWQAECTHFASWMAGI